MTTSDLRNLFVTILVGGVGGEPARWERALGKIQTYPLSMSPACNWSISAKGSRVQRTAIEKAAEVIRAEHPYVDRD